MGQEELKKGGRAQLTNLITANKKYTWIHCWLMWREQSALLVFCETSLLEQASVTGSTP
jgi:hypothetical protein